MKNITTFVGEDAHKKDLLIAMRLMKMPPSGSYGLIGDEPVYPQTVGHQGRPASHASQL